MMARAISPLNTRPGAARGRIVILTADMAEAAVARMTVEAAGSQVVGVCSDPSQALRTVREIRPDLVLSAIFFEGEPDGLEVSRQIQQDLGIPVVYIGPADDPLLMLQISMTQPAGLVPNAHDATYLEAVVSRALKGVGAMAAAPF